MPQPLTDTTARCRKRLAAHTGTDLSVADICRITRLPPTKALYNALGYLTRTGEIERVSAGVYRPKNPTANQPEANQKPTANPTGKR